MSKPEHGYQKDLTDAFQTALHKVADVNCMAYDLRNAGYLSATLSALDTVLEKTPDDLTCRKLRGCLLSDMMIHNDKELKDKHQTAIEDLEACIKNSPRDQDVISALGIAYYHNEDYKNARAYLTKTLKQFPGDRYFGQMLAHAHFKDGNFKAAYAELVDLLHENDIGDMDPEIVNEMFHSPQSLKYMKPKTAKKKPKSPRSDGGGSPQPR